MIVTADDLAYVPALAVNSNLEVSPPVVVLLCHVVHVMLSLTVAYSILSLRDWWFKWCNYCLRGQLKRPIKVTINISVDAASTSCINVQVCIDDTRADKQPPNTLDRIKFTKQSYCVKSFDDGNDFNEGTFSSSGYYTASSNYSENSRKSMIVGGGNVKITRSMLQGTESVPDKAHGVHRHSTKTSQETSQDDCYENGFRAVLYDEAGSRVNPLREITKQQDVDLLKQAQKELPPVHTQSQDGSSELSKRQVRNKPEKEPVKSPQETLHSSLPAAGAKKSNTGGYNKPIYAVLVGSDVKIYNTNPFALLPQNNKFMVKERHQDPSGVTRVKLTLKQSIENEIESTRYVIHRYNCMHAGLYLYAI